MGAKGEELAKKFEAKAQEATAVLEKLSDAEWQKVTEAEKWSVGVTAHHVAGAHQGICGMVKAVASGAPLGGMTMNDIHAMNAKHATEFAHVSKADTLALHKKNVAEAAAVLRGIPDADYAKSAKVLGDLPPMTAEQLAGGLMCSHIDEHLGSIKKTVGK